MHAAVVEIVLGDALLRRDNGVHAGREGLHVLFLRPQHFFREHRIGRLEDAAQEAVREQRRNPISQPAGPHRAPVQIEIAQLFQQTVFDQESADRARAPVCGTRPPAPAC